MNEKKPLRLLMVEDNADDAALLLRELSRSEYEITHERVDTAQAMQAALDRQAWDLVVCDYAMPKFSANEALKLLKQSGHDLPFLIVSGTIGEETAVQAMKAGAHDYLMKGKLLRLPPAIDRELREAKIRAQRAEAEQAMYESEEKFRFIFEHNPVPMWVADKETLALLEVNEAAVSRYGFTRREFLQMKTTDLKAPTFSSVAAGNLLPFTGHRAVNEEKHRLKDGSLIEVEVHSDTLEIAGRRFILTIAQDITARKQTERELIRAREAALQASQLKSEFLANVSHEIRTPLNGVVGMTEILARTPLSKKQRESVEIINLSADALLSVVNDVLDFSKIESGQLDLNITEFNLADAVRETAKIFSYALEKKKVDLEVKIFPDVPMVLKGDVIRLKQILKNILDNAIKFTEQGKVVIRVQKLREENEKITIRISVQDTGIGIGKDARSVIFKPFSQADASSTRKYGGTGLGLAICKRLVDLMHGDIGFESKEGQGTTFWFELPLQKSGEEKKNGMLAAARTPKMAKRTPKHDAQVLVVEDNPVNQKVITEMLKRIGYSATSALSGEQALRMLGENTFDLILMDCQMSEMDGFETTDLIRQAEKSKGARTPIVALTAHAIKGDREKCLQAGMDDYLPKPIDFKVLAATVEKWIKKDV